MSIVKGEAAGLVETSVAETHDAAAPGRGAARRAGGWLGPMLLGYAMGPAALVVLLFLRSADVISRQPVWTYVAVFIAIPVVSVNVDLLYRAQRNPWRTQVRIATHAAAVTVVIYLTGWGPVLGFAYTFVALQSIFDNGSRAWKTSAFWSLTGIAVGQVLVLNGWAPSMLSISEAETLGLMGAFVLVFVIRMAGATSEQKETAEAEVRASEERFRSLVQNSSDTTMVVGSGAIVTYVSPSVSLLLGREPEELIGIRATALVHPDDRDALERELITRLAQSSITEPIQFRMCCGDGTYRHLEGVVADLRDRPAVAGYVVNLRDITERKEVETLLAHQALHDPLTGLPNRLLLVDRLEQALARSRRQQTSAPAVMFLDLDRFKLVNDSLGHGAGDRLLVKVAERLLTCLRGTDTVSRFGGDEFVMVCENVADVSAALALAEQIKRALDEPFVLGDETVHVGVSIGVAFVDEECASVDELLSEADFAMYLAKSRSETGRVQLFDRTTRTHARQRVHTETDLGHALERDELRVFYQPIIDVEMRRRIGVEALVRWQHPTRGLLAPSAFLDVAEQTGLIVPIGAWVLAESCRQVARWNEALGPADRLSLSVNLSGRQLAEKDLAETVARTLQDAAVDPHSLQLYLEVTETLLPTDHEGARRALFELRQLGIDLAIDDFGTGYSSLRYVRELPISIVKIDQSFVAGLGRSRQDEAIVRAVAELGHTLGLRVVAEGVETELQFSKLRCYPCDYAQGYLFGRPQPAELFDPAPLPAPAR
jgi:diguanylate cyclase (GGDEF)-like protein/PAS domain S-box-containing protein